MSEPVQIDLSGLFNPIAVGLIMAERKRIREEVLALPHSPGCNRDAHCWCPIHKVLAIVGGDDE